MGFVASLLAVEVPFPVAARHRRLAAAVPRVVARGQALGAKALHAGPRLDQRAVAVDQPLAVLGEHRNVPHHGIQRQPDKPAEQQIVAELLHQLTLRAHRIEGLQQQGAQQFLRRNRRPSGLGIELLKFRRQRHQRLTHNLADRPQRMIHWHPRLAAHIAEQRFCLRIPPRIGRPPTSRHAAAIIDNILATISTFFRNLSHVRCQGFRHDY
jgi:hypothetical protein